MLKVLENDLKSYHNKFMNFLKELQEGEISSEDAVSELEKLNAERDILSRKIKEVVTDDFTTKKEKVHSNGGGIGVTSNSENVISTDDELTQANDNSKLLGKEEVCRAESFMEYFDFIGSEERRIVREWVETVEAKTMRQEKFIDFFKGYLEEVKEDYYIANIEPSLADNKIYYKADSYVNIRFSHSCNEWEDMASRFAPEYGSELASEAQLCIWYAYRIAKGYWTLEYVCDDSSSAGNYKNAPNSNYFIETSGARSVGGARDGVGNTCKIVKYGKYWMQYGGCYCQDGRGYPVATCHLVDNLYALLNNTVGVVVLKNFSK